MASSRLWSIFWLVAMASMAGCRAASAGGINVSTYHNDNARTGRNLQEKQLSPATVNTGKFGVVGRLQVDGDVYAQPLYLSGVPIGGTPTNVVYVATERNAVYAFEADTGKQIWKQSYISEPSVTTIKPADVANCGNIAPDIGITGTPVIKVDPTDVGKSTLYFVTKTSETVGGKLACVQRLHAIDVVSGGEQPKSPKLIASQEIGGNPIATVSIKGEGTGSNIPSEVGTPGDSDGRGNVQFFPLQENQRPGLLLANGIIYVGWASHCDTTPYHGWLMGFDATSLELNAIFNVTPNGGRAGIWASGAAPAADLAGNLYFSTGNGTFDAELNRQRLPLRGNYGDSVVKLAADPGSTATTPNINGWGLRVLDYFTPFDQAALGVPPEDFDLGSGGVILLEDQTPPLVVLAGKRGVIYVLRRDNLGKFSSASDTANGRIAQRIPADPCDMSDIGEAYGMPTLFNQTLYLLGAPRRTTDNRPVGGESGTDTLKAFTIAAGKLALPSAFQTTAGFVKHTNSPSISANGTTGGVVWIISNNEFVPNSPAVLYAFDATKLGQELYNSEQVVVAGKPRDRAGLGVKFTVPTIANGRVFVGCTGEVTVYGLLK